MACTRWCGPCKQIAPVLEKEVNSHDGKVMVQALLCIDVAKVKMAKVDIDENSELAEEHQVGYHSTRHTQ